MIVHPSLSVLCIAEENDPALEPLLSYLRTITRVQLAVRPRVPEDISPHDVVISSLTEAPSDDQARLEQFVRDGGGWLGLVHTSAVSVPKLFGAQPSPVGPCSELRIYFADRSHPLAARLPDPIYASGHHRSLEKSAEDTEIVLYADWQYQQSPILTARPVDDGRVSCITLQDLDEPAVQQILYRLLRHLAGQTARDRRLGVGILGYSPSVGKSHALGVEATPGLDLRAVCDLDQRQLQQARLDFPYLRTHESASELGSDREVELVIIATPPNSHARLAVQMMEAGKHVVCEKPLALTGEEAAAMVKTAHEQEMHLSCHQNRRWDVDYLAVRQAVAEGVIGELFYMETFVGGFEHPCGLWHSHEAISGGTAYDWGAHYLDWVVSLIPDRVESVVGTRHKRVWHDITNADQERIQVRFAGGQEAEFIHSDIAAVKKPKWYLLGTEGAIVGHWRDVTTYEIDPMLFFQEHEIPTTEMASDLTLYSRHRSGQVVAQELALPDRQPYAFHRNLADHMITGEPIVAPLEQSVQVVAILEAAARSAGKDGTVEVLDG